MFPLDLKLIGSCGRFNKNAAHCYDIVSETIIEGLDLSNKIEHRFVSL